MDPDPFECPICLSMFEGSIFQCKNGHAVCEACCIRIQGTCPSCREPVGDIRCRALENAIADKALPCSFRSHGCTQLLKRTERHDHEAFHCQHAPFACPLQGCPYSGLRLYDHIKDVHNCLDYVASFAGSKWHVCLRRSMPFKVLLDTVDRRVFLLLSGSAVHSGRSLSVVCLGPRPKANQLLKYKLEVGNAGEPGAGEPGALSLSASGSVAYMRSWAGQYPDRFLFVPDAYWTSLDGMPLDRVVVKVRVQKTADVVKSAAAADVVKSAADVENFWTVDCSVGCLKHDSLQQFVLLVLAFALAVIAIALAWKMGHM